MALETVIGLGRKGIRADNWQEKEEGSLAGNGPV
jgi:hypothetical protein